MKYFDGCRVLIIFSAYGCIAYTGKRDKTSDIIIVDFVQGGLKTNPI